MQQSSQVTPKNTAKSCTMLEEKLYSVRVPPRSSVTQRHALVLVTYAVVGPMFEKEVDDPTVSLACRRQKWRLSLTVLVVDVGAVFDEQRNHFHMSVPRRHVQRRQRRV